MNSCIVRQKWLNPCNGAEIVGKGIKTEIVMKNPCCGPGPDFKELDNLKLITGCF